MKKYLISSLFCLFFGTASAQDLVVESMSVEASYYNNSPFTYSISIKNIGILPSNRGYFTVYFGSNATEYTNYVSSQSIPALSANETIVMDVSIDGQYYLSTINEALGTYFVNARIDPDYYNFLDVNPDNNVFQAGSVSVIAPTTDVLLNSYTLNSGSNLKQGQAVSLTVEGRNPGSAIKNSSVGAYLSSDATVDEQDVLLRARGNTLVFDYQSITQNAADITLEIPFNTAPGDYHLLLKADNYDRIDEIDEDNNVYDVGILTIQNSDALLSANLSLNSTNADYTDISLTIYNSGNDDVIYDYQLYSSFDGVTPYYPVGFGGSSTGDMIRGGSSIYQSETIYNYELENAGYILLVSENSDYPGFETQVLFLEGGPIEEQKDFNIIGLSLAETAETSDQSLQFNIELENPHANSIIEHGYIYASLTSADQQITETYQIDFRTYLRANETTVDQFSLENRPTLLSGLYTLDVSIGFRYGDGGAVNFSDEIEILVSDNTITVELLESNGEVIDQGYIYMYEKSLEGEINFLEGKSISLFNNIASVSFSRADGNFLFYVAPDPQKFPNHLATVYGNTFDLKESSFTDIYSDQTLPIRPIYVNPDMNQGNKIIKGNVTQGVVNKSNLLHRNILSGNAIYLLQNDQVIAQTRASTSGDFEFLKLGHGDYTLYFDDGDLIANNEFSWTINLAQDEDGKIVQVNSENDIINSELSNDLLIKNISVENIYNDESSLNYAYYVRSKNQTNDVSLNEVQLKSVLYKNQTAIDSSSFQRAIILAKNDSILLNRSFNFQAPLEAGDYKLVLQLSSPYQDTLEIEQPFTVQERMYTLAINVTDENGQQINQGELSFYEVIEGQKLKLVSKKSLAGMSSTSFSSLSMDYLIYFKPDASANPELLPTYGKHELFKNTESIMSLSADESLDITVRINYDLELDGMKDLSIAHNYEILEDTTPLTVYLQDNSSGKVIKSFNSYVEGLWIYNVQAGSYQLIIQDTIVDHQYFHNTTVNINDTDDIYEITYYMREQAEITLYDSDFQILKAYGDTIVYDYQNEYPIGIWTELYSEYPPYDLNVTFQFEFVNQQTGQVYSYTENRDIHFMTPYIMSHAWDFKPSFDQYLNAGDYTVLISYQSEYNEAMQLSYEGRLKVLDATFSFDHLNLTEEAKYRDKTLSLALELFGNPENVLDSIPLKANFDLYLEGELMEASTSIKPYELKRSSSNKVDFLLDLAGELQLGKYELKVSLAPYGNNSLEPDAYTRSKTIEFEIKNYRFGIMEFIMEDKFITPATEEIYLEYVLINNTDNEINGLPVKGKHYILQGTDTLIRYEWSEEISFSRGSFEFRSDDLNMIQLNNSALAIGEYTLGVVYYSKYFDGGQRSAEINFTVNKLEILNSERDLMGQLEVFPNPAQGSFFIRLDNIQAFEDVFYDLIDSQGRVIQSGEIIKSLKTVPTNGIIAGIYYLRIRTEDNLVGIKKVVVK